MLVMPPTHPLQRAQGYQSLCRMLAVRVQWSKGEDRARLVTEMARAASVAAYAEWRHEKARYS